MEINYLQNLNFVETKKIEDLKISLGEKVIYDENEETSKISTPDLRYYWDGERFGLHVSDYDIDIFTELSNLLKVDNLYDKTKIIYISRSAFWKFDLPETSFSSLFYLNLSENQSLETIAISNSIELRELITSNCPKLDKLELNGGFSKIKKIDLANCILNELKIENWQTLEYLNVENNQIIELDISNLPNLKYLFAQGNERLNLIWPKEWNLLNLSILSVDKSNKNINSDIIEIAKTYSDSELREKIQSFLNLRISLHEQTKNLVEVELNRYQIMFIGNTQSGKTELNYKFSGRPRPKNVASTHGVLHFFETLNDGTEVIGFDFGGQDYYHALHTPFFDEFTHYILVWGNNVDKTWGSYEADCYSGKNEIFKSNEKDKGQIFKNLLFPLKYWLKTVSFYAGSVVNNYHNEKEGLQTHQSFNNIKLPKLIFYKIKEKIQKSYS